MRDIIAILSLLGGLALAWANLAAGEARNEAKLEALDHRLDVIEHNLGAR